MSERRHAHALEARLREASALADLRAERRLDAKTGLSDAAITARLRQVSELRELCLQLVSVGSGSRR